MRFALPALALLLGACFSADPRTIELDTDSIQLHAGASTEIGVWVDGRELSRVDAFSWVVDAPDVVAVEMTPDHAHVRVSGRRAGTTTIHLGYRTSVIAVPVTIE
jgi:hypothetical protein